MTITQFDLQNLKNECSRMVDLIKYIEKSKEYESLFMNRSDYENSLKLKNQIPDEFYQFRLFDVYSTIIFNSKLNKYMIKVKNYYSPVLDNYKNNQRSNDTFIISENFDETLSVWSDVLQDILSNKVLKNGLF